MMNRHHFAHGRAERLPETGNELGSLVVRDEGDRHRHDGVPADEEIGVGMADAAFLGAGERMAADEGDPGR